MRNQLTYSKSISSVGVQIDYFIANAKSSEAASVALKTSEHVIGIYSSKEDLIKFFWTANRPRRFHQFLQLIVPRVSGITFHQAQGHIDSVVHSVNKQCSSVWLTVD